MSSYENYHKISRVYDKTRSAGGVETILQALVAGPLPLQQQVLVDAGDSATGIALRNSSPTRMVRNQFFAEMDALDEPGKKAMDFMPIMGEGSSRIPDDLDGSQGNYTAGTGCGLIREVKPAASIVEDIIAEAEQCMNSLRAAFD